MPPIMEQGYQEDYYAQWNDPWSTSSAAKSKSSHTNWLANRSDLYQHPQQQNTHLPGYYDSYYPPNNVSG